MIIRHINPHQHTEHREDDDAGEHGGAGVQQPHGDGVPEAVVVGRVVGGEGDQAAEPEAEREEDLGAGLQPDHRVGQHLKLQRRWQVRKARM